ncbi:hypothetical protein [Streptomyces tauricus]|uniref:hypothetical protein n=1 Tax=Streptomyces tauricus TaxID=68274 RepID=UPI0027E47880|nr:hypothetical protein [Streptomyces tauricus]
MAQLYLRDIPLFWPPGEADLLQDRTRRTTRVQRGLNIDVQNTCTPARRAVENEDGVGLILFPGDDDTTSPDVAWSYSAFHEFRCRLAQAEGFGLDEMQGFGGERPWSEVSTTLECFLDRPDDGGGELSSAECTAILPRLEAITGEWQGQATTPLLQRHIAGARQLTLVLRFCIEKDVELLFL